MKGYRVFIVEDEAITATMFTYLFDSSNKYQVVGQAGNYADALTGIQATNPTVVLCDIKLADGGDGINLAEKITVPTLFVTALNDEATFARCRTVPSCIGCIIKPVRFHDINSLIQSRVEPC